MPIITQRSFPELVQDGIALVNDLISTRRGGFFVSQKMLTDRLATSFGLVLSPERAAALFAQVTSLTCEFDMPLADYPLDRCRTIAHSIKPHGVVAIQTYPSLIVRFSDARDKVQFRVMLGVV